MRRREHDVRGWLRVHLYQGVSPVRSHSRPQNVTALFRCKAPAPARAARALHSPLPRMRSLRPQGARRTHPPPGSRLRRKPPVRTRQDRSRRPTASREPHQPPCTVAACPPHSGIPALGIGLHRPPVFQVTAPQHCRPSVPSSSTLCFTLVAPPTARQRGNRPGRSCPATSSFAPPPAGRRTPPMPWHSIRFLRR